MIGKPEWFGFRYGGTDPVSINPICWQGWVYFAVFLGMIYVIFHLHDYGFLTSANRKLLLTAWTVAGIADIGHIWYQKMKERYGKGKK